MASSTKSIHTYSYAYFLVTSPSPAVLHVEINRPAKLNSFSQPVWLEFAKLFDQISEDPDVRSVVLSGAGDRAFTAGLDVKAASESPLAFGGMGGSGERVDVARSAKAWRAHIEEFQNSIGAMERCAKPVICCMHGIAIGLAIDIATCADIRLAASNTRFAVKEVDIGIAADIGTLARLPKIVGSHSWVKDVCLSARDFSAAEALSQGFLSGRVYDSKAEVVQAGLEMAARLAEKSPVAVQGTKELLNVGREQSTRDALRYTAVWNTVVIQAEDAGIALMSGMNKTKPKFAKL